MLRPTTALTVLLLCLPIAATAAVIHVPGDQPTIQAGIDAAVDGDTVLVADGTYTGPGNRDIQFFGKAISVASEHGPESCIIDGEGKYFRGVLFQHGEGNDSVLDGFTVRNCRCGWPGGAGIYCEDASPTITNCIVSGNVNSDGRGGGMLIGGPSPVIIGCLIENNVSNGSGGGIRLSADEALISGNTIRNNTAYPGDGDGLYVYTTTVTIENNLITGNQGHGIWIQESDAVLTGNTITGNTRAGVVIWGDYAELRDNEISANSGYYGGGIHCYGAGTIRMSECRVIDNLAQPFGYGAGMLVEDCARIYIDNCIFTGNSFVDDDNGAGGGLYCYNGDIEITNTTIAGNSATWSGALQSQAESLTLTDCILWGNTPDEITVVTGYDDPVLSYCDITGGWPGVGNIDADPLFTNGPVGEFCLGQLAAGQPADSPCLDSGSGPAADTCYQILGETFCMDQVTTRSDLQPDAGQVDMGYHYPATIQPTVAASLNCNPSSGTLPFVSNFDLMIANEYDEQARQIAGRVDLTLGNGQFYPNWRAGYTNLQSGQSLVQLWAQNFPYLPPMVGDNVFVLSIEDVTPAPYNQPPYPPAGDTDTATCAVTGIAP